MTASKAWIASIWGAITGGLSSLAVVLVGNLTLGDLTQAQWLAVIIAAVSGGGGAWGLVYHTSNAPAGPDPAAVYPAPVVTSDEGLEPAPETPAQP
jgi:hypothetical protein